MVRNSVRSAKSPLRMASLPAATPSVELVQSVPTDVYRVPSPAPPSGPQRHVVLVPGNPGQPGFYARAAAELSVALCASVCVVGLAGHREAPLAGLAATARFTLPEQVAHVSAFLGAESEARMRGPSTQRELVVVGHSIGAYIGHEACATAKLATGTKLSFCGLNPYLENNATPENRLRVRGATSWWAPLLTWVLALFAGLLEVIGLKRLLLRNDLAKMEDHCAKVALGLPAFSTLLNILYLFRSEAAELARPFDYARQAQPPFEGRAALMYTTGDYWAPDADAPKAAAAGWSQAIVVPGLPHAWSLAQASRDRVVAAVKELVEGVSPWVKYP